MAYQADDSNQPALLPEDVWLGRGHTILEKRLKIKELTLQLRKVMYQQKIQTRITIQGLLFIASISPTSLFASDGGSNVKVLPVQESLVAGGRTNLRGDALKMVAGGRNIIFIYVKKETLAFIK